MPSSSDYDVSPHPSAIRVIGVYIFFDVTSDLSRFNISADYLSAEVRPLATNGDDDAVAVSVNPLDLTFLWHVFLLVMIPLR